MLSLGMTILTPSLVLGNLTERGISLSTPRAEHKESFPEPVGKISGDVMTAVQLHASRSLVAYVAGFSTSAVAYESVQCEGSLQGNYADPAQSCKQFDK
eukprot:2442802-Amphidinium_carterae.1